MNFNLRKIKERYMYFLNKLVMDACSTESQSGPLLTTTSVILNSAETTKLKGSS